MRFPIEQYNATAGPVETAGVGVSPFSYYPLLYVPNSFISAPQLCGACHCFDDESNGSTAHHGDSIVARARRVACGRTLPDGGQRRPLSFIQVFAVMVGSFVLTSGVLILAYVAWTGRLP